MLKYHAFNLLIPSLINRSIMLQQLLIIKLDSLEHYPIQIDTVDHSLKIRNIFLPNFLISLVKPSQEVPIMTSIILDRHCHQSKDQIVLILVDMQLRIIETRRTISYLGEKTAHGKSGVILNEHLGVDYFLGLF